MCSDRVVVRLRDVSKSYHVYDRPADRLKQLLWGGRRHYGRMFHALRQVSLELREGEVLGVVGRNGAGKSTLLQMLCGTLTPTSGAVEVHGRVAALLELGAGFNPDFTGRENVFLYGAVLGMPQEEIARRFDEIVSFAGLGDFIDQPVKTYSSGMYVRLAFSIATSVEPDVLVVDEALSVGDGEFARKSFDRIMALRDRGTTILFCSHSLYQVEALCTRAIWLDRGCVQRMGDPAEVVSAYSQALDRGDDRTEPPPSSTHAPLPVDAPRGYARIERVTVGTDERSGRELTLITGQSDVWVEVRFACDPTLPAPSVAVTIHMMDGRTICSAATHLHGLPVRVSAQGRGIATVRFPSFALLKGRYFVSAHLLCERGIHLYQTADQVATIDVRARDVAQGVVWLPNEWSLEEGSPAERVGGLSDGNAGMEDPLAWLTRQSQRLAEGETLPDVPATLLCPERVLPRFGFGQNESGAWIKAKTPRWRVAWVGKEQSTQWMRLFESAFGHRMPAAQWDWKYRDTSVLGVGAYAGDDLIAFYGGMPRRAIWQGRSIEVVQVGDVMVEPSQRGVLTRQGPFQLVAATYLEQCIGKDRRFLLGYGFPSSTAMRLAERLDLYAPVDRFVEVSWPAWTGGRNWRFRARALTLDDLDTVDALWAQMATDLPESIVGVRDGAYVRARYLEHPTIRYAVLLVSQRWNGRPAGVVVLNDRGEEGLELLDVIGPNRYWHQLVQVGQRFAAGLARARLFGWITASHAHRLDAPGRQMVEMDLYVPTNVWAPGPSPEQVRDRWLLMAGDSDFR